MECDIDLFKKKHHWRHINEMVLQSEIALLEGVSLFMIGLYMNIF